MRNLTFWIDKQHHKNNVQILLGLKDEKQKRVVTLVSMGITTATRKKTVHNTQAVLGNSVQHFDPNFMRL